MQQKRPPDPDDACTPKRQTQAAEVVPFEQARGTACDIFSLFDVRAVLSTAANGVVLLIQGSTCTRVLKIHDADERGAHELHLYRALQRSSIPLPNIVRMHEWMKCSDRSLALRIAELAPTSQTPALAAELMVMLLDYANGGRFAPQLLLIYQTHVQKFYAPLPYRVNQMEKNTICNRITAAAVGQIYCQLEILRQLIPDFEHGDLNEGNVLCASDPDVDVYIYDLGTETNGRRHVFHIPLAATGGFCLKLIDFELASGTYRAADDTPQTIGTARRVKDYSFWEKWRHILRDISTFESEQLKKDYAKSAVSSAYLTSPHFYRFRLLSHSFFDSIRGNDSSELVRVFHPFGISLRTRVFRSPSEPVRIAPIQQ